MKYKPVLNTTRVVFEGLLFLFLMFVGISSLRLGHSQQRTANDLELSGVVTEGTVLNKRTSTSTSRRHPGPRGGPGGGGGGGTTTSYYVTYSFEANGQPVRREIESESMYRRLTKGEPITIRYLAQNPAVNEIEGSGEHQRRAESTIGMASLIIMIAIIAGSIRVLAWLNWRTFQSSPKGTTQATIVDRRVESNSSGKGGTTYTYYITYRFESPQSGKTFTFEEKVYEDLYNRMTIGSSLSVKYVIAEPSIARGA